MEYLPVEPGKYTINVKFADEDVPGSPFTSNVRPSGDTIQPIEEDLVGRKKHLGTCYYSYMFQMMPTLVQNNVVFGRGEYLACLLTPPDQMINTHIEKGFI